MAEGGADVETFPADDEAELTAPFNLQVIGYVRAAKPDDENLRALTYGNSIVRAARAECVKRNRPVNAPVD